MARRAPPPKARAANPTPHDLASSPDADASAVNVEACLKDIAQAALDVVAVAEVLNRNLRSGLSESEIHVARFLSEAIAAQGSVIKALSTEALGEWSGIRAATAELVGAR